jgi:hypothetical protein
MFGVVIAVFAAVMSVGCDKAKDAAKVSLPETISFTKAALEPEGVDYDAAKQRFLVTSLHEGVVGAVTADGSYTPVFQDPAMVSAIGIRIDAARDRVLVCNSDPGASLHTKPESQGKLAGLAAFTLSTGKLIQYVDLGGLVAISAMTSPWPRTARSMPLTASHPSSIKSTATIRPRSWCRTRASPARVLT